MDDRPDQSTFKRNAHIAYFLRCLKALPTQAQSHDPNRITIAFFCISGLDLLGALYEKTAEEQRDGWIEWIWRLQAPRGGFRGSTFTTTSNPDTSPAHLPSTYTALLTLALLRAPLDRLNRVGLLRFIGSCQGPDGSFSPLSGNTGGINHFQNDVRMTYCASVVCAILDDFSIVDRAGAVEFVEQCRTWEGGYASRPGMIEAQGGTTYCAIASLHLLSDSPSDPTETLRYLHQRQIGGFQGRPGKLEDVCYSFWIGGAINILSKGPSPINHGQNQSFLLSAQSSLGGFGKEPEDYPDPYHSCLALAALAMSPNTDESTLGSGKGLGMGTGLGLKALDVVWNVSSETAGWLREEIGRLGKDGGT